MAGVAQWISGLKNIRSGLDALNNPDLRKNIGYLDSVIEALEEYLQKEKYHNPESSADRDKIKERIRSMQNLNVKGEILEKQSGKKIGTAPAIRDCGIGKHWVRRPKKNGEPGFCRNNPIRNSK